MDAELTILGAGRGLAGRVVASTDYDRRFGKHDGWCEHATGVRSRRFVAEGETASQLGLAAAREALAAAGLEADQLSAILGACGVAEQPIPCFAALMHARLGLAGIPAFDVNATCLSFLAALQFAAHQIAAKAWERVLIVSADIASAALDENDSETAPLFGDGAAAIIVGRGEGRLLAWGFETYSEGVDAAWLGAGGSRLPPRDLAALLAESAFRMNGPLAYRVAAAHLGGFVDRLLERAGWRRDDIDIVIPHQASGAALALMTRRLEFDEARVVNILADNGNQVAASLPSALAIALATGRARKGMRALLIGTGAGVSLGGAALVL
jgi:3-oxoacyl-[acyl-carrier-protein] synthase III